MNEPKRPVLSHAMTTVAVCLGLALSVVILRSSVENALLLVGGALIMSLLLYLVGRTGR